MDISKTLSFMFKSPGWPKNVLVLGLMLVGSFLIAPAILVAGYSLRAMRHVIQDENATLPNWDDWGGDLSRGLKSLLVSIVWSVPFAVACIALVLVWKPDQETIESTNFVLIFVLLYLPYSPIVTSALGDLSKAGKIEDAFRSQVLERLSNHPSTWVLYCFAVGTLSLVSAGTSKLLPLLGIETAPFVLIACSHLAGQAYRISEGKSAVVTPRF